MQDVFPLGRAASGDICYSLPSTSYARRFSYSFHVCKTHRIVCQYCHVSIERRAARSHMGPNPCRVFGQDIAHGLSRASQQNHTSGPNGRAVPAGTTFDQAAIPTTPTSSPSSSNRDWKLRPNTVSNPYSPESQRKIANAIAAGTNSIAEGAKALSEGTSYEPKVPKLGSETLRMGGCILSCGEPNSSSEDSEMAGQAPFGAVWDNGYIHRLLAAHRRTRQLSTLPFKSYLTHEIDEALFYTESCNIKITESSTGDVYIHQN